MIDSDLLDVLLTWDQTGQYEVAELRGDGLDVTGDWMTTLLQTKAFHRIPPANIQAIFMRMQRINYRDRDIVIKQGTEGDFFYVVVAGKCTVTREHPSIRKASSSPNSARRQLRRGSTDRGGQAQCDRHHVQRRHADAPGKNDFQTLLNEPLLQWVDHERRGKSSRAAASGSTCACPANFKISASTMRSISRCISSA